MENNFHERDYDRLGIKLLIEKGYFVKVWRVTSVLHPKKTIDSFNKNEKKISVTNFENIKDLDRAICLLGKSDFIVPSFEFTRNSFLVYHLLSKNSLDYGILRVYPNWKFDYNDNYPFLLKLFKKSKSKIIQIVKKILFLTVQIKPAKYVFVGGSKSSLSSLLVGKKSKIIKIHNFDFEYYNLCKNLKKVLNKKYIL